MTNMSQDNAKISQSTYTSKVVIIDDGFDTPDFREAQNHTEEFWTTLEENPETKEALEEVLGELETPEDLTETKLKELWENVGTISRRSRTIVTKIFPVLEIYDEVTKLKSNLEKMGCNVDQLGSQCDEEDIADPDFIFLDYLLVGEDPSRSIEIATSLMKRFKDSDSSEKKFPIIVLMSTDPRIEDKAQEFIKKTNLIGGNFYVRKKDDLKKESILRAHLNSWSSMLKERGELQNYVDKLTSAFLDNSSQLSEKLRSLSFEDYVNLQQFYLQRDGQPLGDYLLTLFIDLYESLIREDQDIALAKKEIDAHTYPVGLPYYTEPSTTFKGLMKGHTYFNVDKFDPDSADPDKYQLSLGDIFVSDNQLFIICNAECDLAYSKINRRRIKAELPILLIPGKMMEYKGEPLSTPYSYFETGDSQFHVQFKPNQIFSIPYGDFIYWARCKSARRTFRLKNKPAHYFKKLCADHLFRDGGLVSPPISQSMTIQIKTLNKITSLEIDNIEIDEELICFVWSKSDKGKNIQKIMCSVEAVDKIVKILTDKANSLLQEFQDLPDETPDKNKTRAKKASGIAKKTLAKLKEMPTKLLNIELKEGSKDIPECAVRVTTEDPIHSKESNSIFYIHLKPNE